jgi:diguanylate cyclase (GGDEF)-like protein
MRLMLADDNDTFRRFLGDTLAGWGYEITAVADGLAAWQVLQDPDPPRLAILDWVMPGLDGPALCRRLRQGAAAPYTYLLLLTARADKEDLLDGLEAGADDYLVKPVDPHELKARLRTGRRILDLQAQLLAAQEALRHQATHDPLTGLWNRAAVLEALGRELARGRREGQAVGLLLADVDHFKAINDAHGHPAGDAVLRAVARRLAAALRPYDALGRYGGEEFLVVLPDCDTDRTLHLAERLRQAVKEAPVGADGVRVGVTVSVGGAASDAVCPAEAEALLRAADAALYRAKRAGRDRAEVDVPPAAVRTGEAGGTASPA